MQAGLAPADAYATETTKSNSETSAPQNPAFWNETRLNNRYTPVQKSISAKNTRLSTAHVLLPTERRATRSTA